MNKKSKNILKLLHFRDYRQKPRVLLICRTLYIVEMLDNNGHIRYQQSYMHSVH